MKKICDVFVQCSVENRFFLSRVFRRYIMTSPYFANSARCTRSLLARPTLGKTNVMSLKTETPDEPEVETCKAVPAPDVKITNKREKPTIKYETSEDKESNIALKKLKWEPTLWKIQLENIYAMRKDWNAPVDSMGCDVISDNKSTPEVYRYQVLLSLMLSSQTRDQVTSAAMFKLRNHGCNIENILKTPDELLGKLIYPVGFWKRKVIFIKKTSEILKTDFKGDIPNSVEDLCKLPGVGPKMAYLVMKCAWNQILGIGVDTHVHRISNRLGWVQKATKEPEQTRKALEDWLPREYWSDINHLLVGFGQQTCLPVGPKCSQCLNQQICSTGRSSVKKSPGKIKKEIKTDSNTVKQELNHVTIKQEIKQEPQD